MVMLKKGDRVRYVGPIDLPSEQKQGDEGTVTWAGDICIGQVTLRDCVRVKWDAVPFQSHVPAHLVEIVTASPLALNPAVVSDATPAQQASSPTGCCFSRSQPIPRSERLSHLHPSGELAD